MPTWDEILKETEVYQPLTLVDEYLKRLSDFTESSAICYMSAFTLVKPPAPPPFFSIVDQDIQGFMTCSKGINKDHLDLIIHSPGGDYEATKRIINYLHETYKYIRVFIPHMAMSGATLIACAADEIYMGPYSSLGPTDPQVFIGGRFVPVGAVIKEFEKAFEEVKNDPAKALLWRERLRSVPFGLVESLRTMQKNSLIYLQELLKKRNCKELSDDEIRNIAKVLNSHAEHSSHGRGISLKEAQDLKLNVKDIRQFPDLEDKVLSVYHSVVVFFQNTPATKIIANHQKRRYLMQLPPPFMPVPSNKNTGGEKGVLSCEGVA